MQIGIVIITYESADVVGSCLKSIPSGHEVIVVDNGSQDDSVKIAAASGAKVIRNDQNFGFGTACNIGAKSLSSSFVLFLNPDAILSHGSLDNLKHALGRYPDAGALGPKVVLPHSESSFRYHSYIEDRGSRYVSNEEAPAGDCCVNFIDGTAMLCNRAVFLSLGGFDENLFLYYEDDDISFRIRSAGFSLVYIPSAIVYHQKKRSSKPSLKLDYRRAWHETNSRIKISKKYGLPFDAKTLRRRALIRLTRAILTVRPKKAVRYLAAFLAASQA